MKLYWAAAINFGNRIELHREQVDANDFSRYPDTFAIRPFYSDGAPGYVSHMAFGRTEEDASRKLDMLKWQQHATDVRDVKHRAGTAIRYNTFRSANRR